MEAPHSIALRREPGPLARSLTALLLRLGLGLLLLCAGLDKIGAKKEGKWPPEAMVAQYEKAHLPGFPDKPLPGVQLFFNALPYAETGVGALLILGSLTALAAFASGALLLLLLFGKLITHDPQTIHQILTYLIINAGILWLSPVTSNYLSVDGLLFGWFWAPRPEGEYIQEPRGDSRKRR